MISTFQFFSNEKKAKIFDLLTTIITNQSAELTKIELFEEAMANEEEIRGIKNIGTEGTINEPIKWEAVISKPLQCLKIVESQHPYKG